MGGWKRCEGAESQYGGLQGWPGSSGSLEFSWGKQNKTKAIPKETQAIASPKRKRKICSVASSSLCSPLVAASTIPVVAPQENNGFGRLPYVYSAISWKKDFINASVSVSPWVKSTRATEESQLAWNSLVSNVCFAVVSLKSIVKAHKITSRS